MQKEESEFSDNLAIKSENFEIMDQSKSEESMVEEKVDPMVVMMQQLAEINKCMNLGFDRTKSELLCKLETANEQLSRKIETANLQLKSELSEQMLTLNNQINVKFDEKFNQLANELAEYKITVNSKQTEFSAHVDRLEEKVTEVEDRLSKEIVSNAEQIVDLNNFVKEECKNMQQNKAELERQFHVHKQDTLQKMTCKL